MALIEEVQKILNRLDGKGWHDLFLNVTNEKLNIRADNLEEELT